MKNKTERPVYWHLLLGFFVIGLMLLTQQERVINILVSLVGATYISIRLCDLYFFNIQNKLKSSHNATKEIK